VGGGPGRGGPHRRRAFSHNRSPIFGNHVPVSGHAGDPNPKRNKLRPGSDPDARDSPLRDLARGAAAIGGGDQDQSRRDEVTGPALQLPGLWAGPRLPHVGLVQPGRHHGVPGGGSQVGPLDLERRAGPAGPYRTLPYAASRRPDAARLVPLRSHVFSGGGVPARQRSVQAGAGESPRGGLREGVGHDHDRRAEGVLRGGAGADGGGVLRRCDGA